MSGDRKIHAKNKQKIGGPRDPNNFQIILDIQIEDSSCVMYLLTVDAGFEKIDDQPPCFPALGVVPGPVAKLELGRCAISYCNNLVAVRCGLSDDFMILRKHHAA